MRVSFVEAPARRKNSIQEIDHGQDVRTQQAHRPWHYGRLGDFVSALAHRIAKFPAAGQLAIKERVNAIALAPAEDFRRDSDLFLERARSPEAQNRIKDAVPRGFQTRDGERDLARMLGELADQ